MYNFHKKSYFDPDHLRLKLVKLTSLVAKYLKKNILAYQILRRNWRKIGLGFFA